MSGTLMLLLAIVVATLAPIAIRPLLKRLNLVDVPNHRSSHTVVTLRGAGLGVVLTIALLWIGIAVANLLSIDPVAHWVVGGIVVVAAIGLTEDLVGIPVIWRLITQMVVATALSAGLTLHLGTPLTWVVPLTVVALFVVNSANFMDGINGLSALHGIILGLATTAVGAKYSIAPLVALGALICLSFTAFLPWNFPKARMFLGDVGSYTLGAAQWGIGAWIFLATGELLLAVAPVAIYSVDVSATLISRGLRKKPLTVAHREHIYQWVQQATESHTRATVLAALATLLITSVAMAASWTNLPTAVGWCIVAIVSAFYLLAGTVARQTITRKPTERR